VAAVELYLGAGIALDADAPQVKVSRSRKRRVELTAGDARRVGVHSLIQLEREVGGTPDRRLAP
jgi:hypothetical protein